MIKTIKIDIDELVSMEMNTDEQIDLMQRIMFIELTDKQAMEQLKYMLEQYKQTEEEFDKRKELIEAYSNLIKLL
jgi:hypothetical protein